jgi:DNA-binding transcriptional ArsR family regulator
MKMTKYKENGIQGENIDRIIHEPARLKIMIHLNMVDESDFIYLLHKTGLSKGNLSSHLSKLENAGYVSIKKEFAGKIPRTLISISEIGSKAFDRYREIMNDLIGGNHY